MGWDEINSVSHFRLFMFRPGVTVKFPALERRWNRQWVRLQLAYGDDAIEASPYEDDRSIVFDMLAKVREVDSYPVRSTTQRVASY